MVPNVEPFRELSDGFFEGSDIGCIAGKLSCIEFINPAKISYGPGAGFSFIVAEITHTTAGTGRSPPLIAWCLVVCT
jgi:hypothetical protein